MAYVVTNPEFLQTLAGAGPDWGTRALFSVEHFKIGLLEGESTSPGSVVAYLMEMKLDFGVEERGSRGMTPISCAACRQDFVRLPSSPLSSSLLP